MREPDADLEPQRIGVILCGCEGRIADKVNLNDVSHWLMENHPTIVTKISDVLCKKPNELSILIKRSNTTNIIIGACSKYRELFEETAARANLKPFCLKTVNLLERCILVHSMEDAAEKAKIMLSAAVSRERKFKGVAPENLKLTMTRLNRKLDRRTFLTFPVTFRYKVVPTIDADACARWRGCDLCINACPKQALSKQGQKIQIDTSECEGCGTCTVTCPNGAILFPTHSPGQIDEEVRTLVSANADVLKPRIILFTCSDGATLVDELASKGFSYPPNLLVVEVPCIGMIRPFFLLRAFELGADAIALVSCQGKCRFDYDLNQMYENMQISAELLKVFGVGSGRIRAIMHDSGDLRGFHIRLKTFAENVIQLGPHPLQEKEPSELNKTWNILSYLVKQIADKLNLNRNIQVYSPRLPFWVIEVDADRCSLCGLCASHCPTNAINLKREETLVQLLFNYSMCMACGICMKHCPEKVIHSKNVLDLGLLDGPVSILMKDKMAKCQLCGVAFLPEGQIKVVSNRISEKPDHYTLLISRYCPNCRIKAWLKSHEKTSTLIPQGEKRN